MTRETTADDLELFKTWFKQWAEILHLEDWDYKFKLCDVGAANARCDYDTETRKALIKLSDHVEPFLSMEECAKHEAIELLLGDIGCYMSSFISERIVATEMHRVINKLMIAVKI